MTERAKGFVSELGAAKEPVQPVVVYGKNDLTGGYEMGRELIAQHPEITAIFAANDIMAFGIIRALNEAGRRIPADVSVIGFDDLEFSGIVSPPLTSIHQPKYEVGEAAVQILLRHADRKKRHAPEHKVFEVRLMERESCMARPA
jgi:LacI family transcriptional regulator